ncbi:MAG: malonic semialdehyde reductase [Proteobacteria bacterium]|nr:malonic semialdehyde reductase [Pseudomonadota bacterium]
MLTSAKEVQILDNKMLDAIFRDAHTPQGFLDTPVPDEKLREIYDLMKWAPTTMNTQPMRIVFVRSKAAKDKLAPALSPGNLEKTMKAQVTAIIAYDSRFYELLPKNFLNNPKAKDGFEGEDKKAMVDRVALRNGSLQGAYFIIAARALGVDCGPMSGFDNAKVDAAFFADGRWKSNFLVNLGKADPAKIFPRNPRLTFDEACKVL